jgi:hypothetical protein
MKLDVVTVRTGLGLLLSTLAGVAMSFAGAGCGPGGNGGSGGHGGTGGSGGAGGTAEMCGVPPCGGDVVGNWTASSACMDHAIFSAEFLAGVQGACPTASLGTVSVMPTGTLNLAADMSFTGALTVNAMVDLILPAACVMGETCDQVAQPLQSLVGRNGVISVTCAGTDSCTCTIAQIIPIINATGTWATSGTTLTFAEAPGGDGPFCVQGSSLHLIGYDLATNTMISNDIVLTKP